MQKFECLKKKGGRLLYVFEVCTSFHNTIESSDVADGRLPCMVIDGHFHHTRLLAPKVYTLRVGVELCSVLGEKDVLGFWESGVSR